MSYVRALTICLLLVYFVSAAGGHCFDLSKDPRELMSQFVVILLEMGKKKYRADVERFEYIFDQLEQLKIQEVECLEETNGAGDDFLDDDDDVEMDNDDNIMSKCMKMLDKLLGVSKKSIQC